MLTLLYISLQSSEELQRQKDENLSLNNYIEQIRQELDDKTPALQQLRRNYDETRQKNEQLTQKLNSFFEECESLRLESEDSVKQAKVTERENQRLRQLTADLGRQVKVRMTQQNFFFFEKQHNVIMICLLGTVERMRGS